MKLSTFFQNKLIIAGLLLILGFIIKSIALFNLHPITFVLDLALSSLFICAGIVLYLVSVFSK